MMKANLLAPDIAPNIDPCNAPQQSFTKPAVDPIVFGEHPDFVAANRFLAWLGDEVHAFALLPDKTEAKGRAIQLNGTLDEHFLQLANRNNDQAGVFVVVNQTDGLGFRDANVTKVRALFVDLDGSDIEPVRSCSLPPQAIVETSAGRWHAYWKVSDVPVTEFSNYQDALAKKFGGDPSVKNPSRLMRLPGFFHCKASPSMVGAAFTDGCKTSYLVQEMEQLLEGFIDVPALPTARKVVTAFGRNAVLTKLAGKLRREGLEECAILERLVNENERSFDPSLPLSEVANIAKSVSKYSTGIETAVSTTDTGNAKLFVDQHDDELRYVPERGKWLVWGGTIWRDDARGEITERAKETAKSLFEVASTIESDVSRGALAKHAAASLNQGRLSAMVNLARTDRRIVAPLSLLDKDDLLLAVGNGVIDLRTGHFRESHRDDLITRQSAVNYEAGAMCPTFVRFLDRITDGDVELQGYLQRFVGYSLTGMISEQCFAFLYGHGANGKSTFLDVMIGLCGDYATQTQPEALMSRRGGGASSDLARLAGKRLVVSNEVREGAQLEENLIKQMVGGDVVTARFLYQEHFEFRPKFKLVIAGNHMPIIKGDDHGIWRRVHFVPFVHTIPEKERDKSLGKKLEAELPGILNWAIAGCLEWQSTGLRPPKVITDATQRYRDEMDLLKHWLDQECSVGTGLKCLSRVLYDSHRKWCELTGVRPMSSMIFVRKLEMRGFRRVHERTGNYIVGLGLRHSACGVAA